MISLLHKKLKLIALSLLTSTIVTGCGGGGGGSGDGTTNASTTTPATTTATTPANTTTAEIVPTPTIVSKWSAPIALGFQCCATGQPVPTGGIPISVTATGKALTLFESVENNNTAISLFSKEVGAQWQSAATVTPVMPYDFNNQRYRKYRAYSDSSGNVFATWTYINNVGAVTDRDYVSKVYVSRYNAATSNWSAPYLLQNDSNAYADDLKLYVQPDGVAWAVWNERTFNDAWFSVQDRYAVFTAKFTPQSGWEPAEKVSSDYYSVSSKIRTDHSGNPYVLFAAVDTGISTDSRLLYTHRLVNGTWSPSFEVVQSQPSGGLTNQISEFDLAVDSSGNALTIWRLHDGTREAIFTRRKAALGGWTSAHQLMLQSNDNGFAPQLAMDKAGNAFVVWHESDGMSYAIWASRFDRNTGWSIPDVISSTARTFGDDSTFPSIGFDDAGNAIAVWQKYDFLLNTTIARANRYSPISGWGNDETISDPNSGVVNSITLGVSTNGYATAIWWQQKNNIYSARSSSFAP